MLGDLALSWHRLELGLDQDSFAQQAHLDVGTPPAAHQSVLPLDSSDDDMDAAADAPRFVRGHTTYGDAEFFICKVSRLVRSRKYATYRLDAKIATLSHSAMMRKQVLPLAFLASITLPHLNLESSTYPTTFESFTCSI